MPKSKARRPRAPSRDAERTYSRIVKESTAAWVRVEKLGVPAPDAIFTWAGCGFLTCLPARLLIQGAPFAVDW